MASNSQIVLARDSGLLVRLRNPSLPPTTGAAWKKEDEFPTLRILYFANRRLEDAEIESLLHHIQDPEERTADVKAIQKLFASYQNLMFARHIQTVVIPDIEKRLAHETDRKLADLSTDELSTVIGRYWELNPRRMAEKMWGSRSFALTIDFEAIFDTPESATADQKRLMDNWRHYCLVAFTRAIMGTLEFRMHPDPAKKDIRALYVLWRMTAVPGFNPNIDEVPVCMAKGGEHEGKVTED